MPGAIPRVEDLARDEQGPLPPEMKPGSVVRNLQPWEAQALRDFAHSAALLSRFHQYGIQHNSTPRATVKDPGASVKDCLCSTARLAAPHTQIIAKGRPTTGVAKATFARLRLQFMSTNVSEAISLERQPLGSRMLD